MKIKKGFPLYVVEQRESPICDKGDECELNDNAAHHVAVDLTPEVRAILRDAAHLLELGFMPHYNDYDRARACRAQLLTILRRAKEAR